MQISPVKSVIILDNERGIPYTNDPINLNHVLTLKCGTVAGSKIEVDGENTYKGNNSRITHTDNVSHPLAGMPTIDFVLSMDNGVYNKIFQVFMNTKDRDEEYGCIINRINKLQGK